LPKLKWPAGDYCYVGKIIVEVARKIKYIPILISISDLLTISLRLTRWLISSQKKP